jgi:hypothetical protein
MRFPMKWRLRVAGVFTVFSLACVTKQARADIKSDTAHPNYFFEAEPHLAIAPFNENEVGVGAGFAGTFNVANEGFIKRLNDSVGVGFGADWTGNNNWNLSAAMQWNFWLSDKWSVFGAPGVGLHLHNGGDVDFRPAFGAGGRFHFTPNFALTMRVGYPVSAVGLSFFL